MPGFFMILFLCFTFNHNLSEARHGKKLPSAVVVGTVYCDTCFQDDFSKNSHFISGASVAVECKDDNDNSRPSFHQEVKTNEHGEFRVHLPFSVGKHVRKIKKCSVQLLSSSEPYCAVASTATSSSLRLKSKKQGIHIFSAGFFSFKPQKQPFLCNQKPSIQNSEDLNSRKISATTTNTGSIPLLSPLIQDPIVPNLPPVNPLNYPPLPSFLPSLPPLPKLPPLPPLPGLPTFPPLPGNLSKQEQTSPENFKKTQETDNLSGSGEEQPNFFLPTPPLLPPNPLQPPSLIPPLVPPLLPPNPLQPPTTPVIPLPPIPGITPPSPPPIFPLPPIPALPIPPTPSIPGIPPASSSSSSSTSQKPSP